MSKSKSQNISDEVEAALGAPSGCELPENLIKIRRNLLIAGFTSIVSVIAGVKVSPNSTIFGFQFTGLNDQLMRIGLLIVVIYLIVHYLWCLYDQFLAWRIRVTGTRLAFVTTGKFASKYGDYPDDPNKSSLYWWWHTQASHIGNISPKILEIESSLKQWESKVNELMLNKADSLNLTNGLMGINQVLNSLQQINSSIAAVEETLSSERIPVSLKRFDNAFMLLLRSQNLRWLIIDAVFPVFIGGYGLYLLINAMD